MFFVVLARMYKPLCTLNERFFNNINNIQKGCKSISFFHQYYMCYLFLMALVPIKNNHKDPRKV